jgi:hypothetical protein
MKSSAMLKPSPAIREGSFRVGFFGLIRFGSFTQSLAAGVELAAGL